MNDVSYLQIDTTHSEFIRTIFDAFLKNKFIIKKTHRDASAICAIS
jgi:hypothetical protein